MEIRTSEVAWGSNSQRVQCFDSAERPLYEVRIVPKDQARAFRDTLVYGTGPDWTPFLTGLLEQDRLSLLVPLVIGDLARRWSRGERPLLESYARAFPALRSGATVPMALIVGEYNCRIKAGEPVDLAEYRNRFPNQYPAILAELGLEGAGRTIPDQGAPRIVPFAEGTIPAPQRYEFVRELGRGTFGEVWLARGKPSGIEKAIKIVSLAGDPTRRESRAIELIKNVRHPYLLTTECFWVTGSRLYIVTELADGTLRHRLGHHRSSGLPGVPKGELLRYASEAAEALDYLHARCITHRDVKADYILFLCEHAKVADLGLAYLQDASIGTMSCAGTPSHMAPELWGGRGGPASDQYSLAIAYTELRQGHLPIRAGTLMELMTAHEDGRHEFTEVICEAERAVLRRALDRAPNRRYPTCGHFVEALRRA